MRPNSQLQLTLSHYWGTFAGSCVAVTEPSRRDGRTAEPNFVKYHKGSIRSNSMGAIRRWLWSPLLAPACARQSNERRITAGLISAPLRVACRRDRVRI